MNKGFMGWEGSNVRRETTDRALRDPFLFYDAMYIAIMKRTSLGGTCEGDREDANNGEATISSVFCIFIPCPSILVVGLTILIMASNNDKTLFPLYIAPLEYGGFAAGFKSERSSGEFGKKKKSRNSSSFIFSFGIQG